MTARAIPNGKTVTLRLNADQVLHLKITALRSGIGLSELVGQLLTKALDDGGLHSAEPGAGNDVIDF